jgi:two-component system, sensor histidine kinase
MQEEMKMVQHHKLLERQIRKWLPSDEDWSDEMKNFVNAVSESYFHNDNDRALLTNAMRESNAELNSKKQQLNQMLAGQSKVLNSLRDAASKLLPEMQIAEDSDLLNLADILQQEIAKRQIAEHRKAESEQRMDNILNTLNLGMAEYDLNGEIISVQERFAELFGIPTHELIGKNEQFFHFESEGLKVFEPTHALKLSFKYEVFEANFKKSNDEIIWLLCTTAPVYDDLQKINGGVMVVFDITPQKKLESQLRHARRAAEAGLEMRKSILANVSHELRTPVNAIVGMSSLLSRTELNALQEEYIQTLKFSADGLLVLIDDLLDVSKIESGKVELETISFSLEKLISFIWKSHSVKASDKGVELSYSVDLSITPHLFGDPHRLSQVLNNLVANAIKFTHEGEIKIHVKLIENKEDSQVILFSVNDTGIGIAPDRQNAVFQEFSQEDSSTTRKYGGTGLGLSISRKIVEMMKGELKLKSEKFAGSEFYFTLEFLKSGNEVKEQVSFNPDMAGTRILLVEDNHINQYLASTIMRSWSASVEIASNGQQAIELLRKSNFAIILMDLQMPVMDGYEAAGIIRNEMKLNTPIIALTANALSGERDTCIQAGMNDYVSKPFQPELLYEKIKSLVD